LKQEPSDNDIQVKSAPHTFARAFVPIESQQGAQSIEGTFQNGCRINGPPIAWRRIRIARPTSARTSQPNATADAFLRARLNAGTNA
jgi:hypothetical protein